MIVSTKNEYDELKSVLVGGVDNFAWPLNDNEFDKSIERSTYEGNLDKKNIDSLVLEEAREDLDRLSDTLTS